MTASGPMLGAGHSLGEYTALVHAGALTFEAALKLVQRRGALMSEFGRGGMLATTLELPAAAALADKHFCGIGGCNLPDQTVVAGESSRSRRAGCRVGDAVSEQARRAPQYGRRVPHLSHGQRGAGVS